jgi:hypothetical protein
VVLGSYWENLISPMSFVGLIQSNNDTTAASWNTYFTNNYEITASQVQVVHDDYLTRTKGHIGPYTLR